MLSCAGFLDRRKSIHGSSKSTFNAENFIIAARPCVSLSIPAQFALEMCFAAPNHQKSIKKLYFGVQSHPRSLLSVTIESP